MALKMGETLSEADELRSRFRAINDGPLVLRYTRDQVRGMFDSEDFNVPISTEFIDNLFESGAVWYDSRARESQVISPHGIYRILVAYLLAISGSAGGMPSKELINQELSRRDGEILFENAPFIAQGWIGRMEEDLARL